nr:MAG TPA: hypothetical protein [Caudoviricetes sp.]
MNFYIADLYFGHKNTVSFDNKLLKIKKLEVSTIYA